MLLNESQTFSLGGRRADRQAEKRDRGVEGKNERSQIVIII